MTYQPMSLRRHLLNRLSQAAIRAFPPVHRGWADRPHLARWDLTGPDHMTKNPWWNMRWLMEARTCSSCGEIRTRAIGWQR